MAALLEWKEGEGYDIHVLRGTPASKALDGSLELDTLNPNARPPEFVPHFKGAPNNHGVDVIAATGEVTATAQPPSPKPKFPNFNFLMTARQIIGGIGTFETKIRIHIHDSIKEIWLTPSTLTAHVGSDECRFTVLARFNDDVVGDITDWPQLTYLSANLSAVTVNGRGVLKAEAPSGSAPITVNLTLTSLGIDKTSLPATALARPSWPDVSKGAIVKFVGGPVRPNEKDLDSPSPDSVKSVEESRANILFISEGFLKNQEQDFRQKIVDVIVNSELRAKESLQPFKLLADSINYWSVFVESQDEGTSVLGDQETGGPNSLIAFPVPLPRQPAPSAAEWTVANMIHEGGLPLPLEAGVGNPAEWVANRAKLYDIPATAPATPEINQLNVEVWNELRSRSLLNELNSAFGLAHYDRPRASGQNYSDGRLLLDRRRMSETSLQSFLENLRFGKDLAGSFWGIGKTWVESAFGGKDAGLVCFVCWSGTRGGILKPPSPSISYFTASTGRADRTLVKAVANGQDIRPPFGTTFSAPLLASLVAYGCGRALGLGDEDGDGEGNVPGPTTLVFGRNVQEEVLLVSTTSGVRSIDAKKIAWLWPRVINAGVVKVDVDISGKVLSPETCDANGIPNPTGSFVLVQFLKSPLKPFAKGDLVRLRASLIRSGSFVFWQEPSQDEFVAFPLFVEKLLTNKLVLGHQTPSLPQLGYLNPAGPQLDLTLFDKVVKCFLIGPRILAGAESKLAADPIWKHIDSSDSPLNAPLGSQGQACTPAPHARADVTARNLPPSLTLPTTLPSKADIIGMYDGGGHFDCGVFRPAGRCRMRRGLDATTPFCHVCRYIIVDRVDPTIHGVLDDLYQLQYPT